MRRTACWTVCVIVWLAAAACEHYCPDGYYKQKDTCYRVRDAGGDAETEADAETVVDRDGGDSAEAGGSTGAAAEDAGEIPQDGARSADLPQIQGAPSMAPGRELWTWSTPTGTDHFEILVDDVAPPTGGKQSEPSFSARLEVGDHTLKVRACRADKSCSGWAVHTTRVESFGGDLPRGLRDAARSVPATALGHRVAIGCNDCADGPNSEVYNLEQAAASIERAIDRGADLVEFNVASIGGILYVSPSDGSSAGARPKLADLLQREKIANSDSLLAIDLIEAASAVQDESAPETIAENLFAIIDENPKVARNGRPLWVRTSYANHRYLKALLMESGHHAVTGPYLRFVVSDPGRDPATFYGAANEALIPNLEFVDAVSVDFRLASLPFRLERIRAAGAAVVVEGIPGPGHGEIVLGALREQADVFIAEYRVDQARRIVARPDTGAFFSAKDIAADGRILRISGVRQGSLVAWEPELDAEILDSLTSGILLDTPVAVLDSAEGNLFGPYLSFDQGIRALPVGGPRWALEPSSGFLFSFSGTLPSLEPVQPSVMFGCWPESEAAGISSTGKWSSGLRTENGELIAGLATPEASQNSLKSRAVIRVPSGGGAGCTSRNESYVAPLKAGDVHWFVLSYASGSGLVLFIDGKCAAQAWAPGIEGDDDIAATTMVGSGIFGAYYTGHLQQFGVLRWDSTTTDSVN